MSAAIAIPAAVFLVLLNGFFVAAEFAIVKVRATRVEELVGEGNRRAAVLQHIIQHLDAYLSACQLGITIASLGLGWIGEPAAVQVLEPAIVWFGVTSEAAIHAISFGVAFSLISFAHIVAGEVAPKTVAVRNPERWGLLVALPLRGFFWIMFPFIWLLNASSNLLLRIAHVEPASEAEMTFSETELRLLVASSHERGVLDGHEREMLDNVFEFGDQTVHEVMVPRTRMAVLYTDRPIEENMTVIRDTMHTRYPLVSEDHDHVLGMVHLKDLYLALANGKGGQPSLEAVKREILAVPETMPIDDLLNLFRRRRIHMAVAIDEFGGTSGLVTLEDLLEELVGEIEDEFDDDDEPVIEEGPDRWSVVGGFPLKDLAKLTEEALEEEDVDTIGGLLMLRMNRIPKQGDRLDVGGLSLEVVRMHAYQVGRVRVIRRPPPPDEDEE